MDRCTLALSPETLSAWQARLLPSQEQHDIATHIPHCVPCQRTLAAFARMAHILQQEPPASFSGHDVWNVILRHILHEERGPMHTTRPLVGVAVAAALILIAALVFTHMSKQPGASTLPPPTATTSMVASPTIAATQTATRSPTSTSTLPTLTPTVDPRSRIHNASPNNVPLFVSISYTSATTYKQAAAILPNGPYGENCDGVPRTPFPATYPETQFRTTHMLLMSYATWNQLLVIAADPHVTSVDGTSLPPCP